MNTGPELSRQAFTQNFGLDPRMAFVQQGDGYVGGDDHYWVGVHGRAVEVAPDPAADSSTAHVAARPLRLQTLRVGATDIADSASTTFRVREDGHLAAEYSDGVSEHLRNTPRGVEQSWTFDQRPQTDGDLVVSIAASGQRFVGTTVGGLHFRDDDSGVGVVYSHATWIDATGRRTEVPVALVAQNIEVRLPEDLLDDSAYPAVLDPTIGPEFGMDQPIYGPATDAQKMPAIGHSSYPNAEFLVVWQDRRRTSTIGGGHEIFGAHVTRQGTVLEQVGFLISAPNEVGDHTYPEVTWDAQNSAYVVVYRSPAGGIDARVLLGAVSTTPDAATFPVASFTACNSNCSRPDIAWSYTTYPSAVHAIVWESPSGLKGTVFSLTHSGPSWFLSPMGASDLFPVVPGMNSARVAPASIYGSSSKFLVVGGTADGSITKYMLSSTGAVTSLGYLYTAGGGSRAYRPSVTWVASATCWVVATDFFNGTSFDVTAWRVSDTGVNQGFSITVGAGAGDQKGNGIGNNGNGDAFVTYASYPSPSVNAGIVEGRIVRPYGTTLSTPYSAVTIGGISMIENGRVLVHSDDYDRYFAVWPDIRAINGVSNASGEIYGGLVSYSNTLLSPLGGFLITKSANMQAGPAVASCGSRYLVAWTDRRNDPLGDVYGALVDNSGSVLVANIPIGVASGLQGAPRIACDGANFYVVWTDLRTATSFDVWGQVVNGTTGAILTPGGVQVTSGSGHNLAPSVAYGDGIYRVVYSHADAGTIFEIETVPVSTSTGAPLDLPRTVVDGTGPKIGPSAPDIAYSDDASEFLIVWQSISLTTPNANSDIWGAIVDNTVYAPFVIESDAAHQRSPRVAYGGKLFNVVFEDDRNLATTKIDVYARPVKPSGVVLAGFVVANTAVDEVSPTIATRDQTHQEVSFTRRTANVFDSGVYGQELLNAAVSGAAYVISNDADTREMASSIGCADATHCLDAYQWYETGEGTYGTDRVMARGLSY